MLPNPSASWASAPATIPSFRHLHVSLEPLHQDILLSRGVQLSASQDLLQDHRRVAAEAHLPHLAHFSRHRGGAMKDAGEAAVALPGPSLFATKVVSTTNTTARITGIEPSSPCSQLEVKRKQMMEKHKLNKYGFEYLETKHFSSLSQTLHPLASSSIPMAHSLARSLDLHMKLGS